MNSKNIRCLSASSLKIIAMIFMFIDHLWATSGSGNMWMTNIGRIAFPIFAFQIAEGYTKTSNFKKYLQRLLIFALISEIPFNFMTGGGWLNPFDQNVMFTFIISLLMIRLIDKAHSKYSKVKYVILTILICLLGFVLGTIFFVDYKGAGVLVVLIFYIFRDVKFGKLIQFLLIGYIFAELIQGMGVDVHLFGKTIFFFPFQLLGMLAFIPILLYNGKKGIKAKWFQYFGYAFYPAHIAILVIIAIITK